MAREDELNKIAAQAQGYQQQMSAITGQLNGIQSTLDELANTVETLNNISAAKGEVLIPIGAGIYMRSRNADVERVLVNVGSNVMNERGVKDAVEFLERRSKSLSGLQVRLQRSADEISKKLSDLDLQARRLVGELNANVRPSQE